MPLQTWPNRRRAASVCAVLAGCLVVSGCQTGSSTHEDLAEALAPEKDAPDFTSKEFGVAASPRMVRTKRVPKGGGRDQVGKPYQVRGKWYYPKDEKAGFTKSGTASWYGANFHGRLTANGEIYDMYHLSAAHPTFPLPSYARVTNRKNGASVMVRVNDRGPYMHGRVLDVSQRAAELLDFRTAGVADVKVEYVGRAPLEGDDTEVLMASYHQGNARPIDGGLPSGVMVAEARPGLGSRLASLFGRRDEAEAAPPATLMAMNAPVRASRPAPTAPRAVPAAAPAAAAPLSIEDLIQSVDGAAPAAVPVPAFRTTALGYAPASQPGASLMAIDGLMRPTGGATPELVEIGSPTDLGTLAGVADALSAYRFADVGDAPLQTVRLLPGQDVDALLRRLWEAGATDAFVIRD